MSGTMDFFCGAAAVGSAEGAGFGAAAGALAGVGADGSAMGERMRVNSLGPASAPTRDMILPLVGDDGTAPNAGGRSPAGGAPKPDIIGGAAGGGAGSPCGTVSNDRGLSKEGAGAVPFVVRGACADGERRWKS